MNPYFQCLHDTVVQSFGCPCEHSGTSHVVEFYEDAKVFDGNVETFTLSGHPQTDEAFAWGFHNGEEPHYVAVLKVPPIQDPSDAIRAAIASGVFR